MIKSRLKIDAKFLDENVKENHRRLDQALKSIDQSLREAQRHFRFDLTHIKPNFEEITICIKRGRIMPEELKIFEQHFTWLGILNDDSGLMITFALKNRNNAISAMLRGKKKAAGN